MGSEAEPAKQLLPYLQRADELQKHEPLVAYYCRLFAMERGLKIPSKERTKTTNSILVSLMNQLEKDKKTIKLAPDDSLHVEGFASSIFAKADKQDRAGRADLNTAKTFYAAYVFFEVLSQFGELQPDIEQKMKYAVWKAADIRKALKEGRKPEPGPPGGELDLSDTSSSATNTYDLGPSASFSTRSPSLDTSLQHVDKDLAQSASFSSRSPSLDSSYRSSNYPSGDLHHTLVSKAPEDSDYPQPYRQQSYPTDQSTPQNYPSRDPQNYLPDEVPPQNYYPQGASVRNYPTHDSSPPNYPTHESSPQNYPSHDGPIPPYTYPNFQSYPSFNDSILPTAPTHYPSHHQASDAASAHQSFSTLNYTPTVQYASGSGNGTHPGNTPSPAAAYTYDSNYQPSVEKIADAHKAARFAVGALAFDDVPVAVDFLRRSLELLTDPSAESH